MKIAISSVLLVLVQILSAQKSDCSEIKTELQNNKVQNAELSKQVEYYKETLNLLKPLRTVNVDGIELSITKIVGSKKDKSLSVTLVYQNKDSETRSFFQCEQAFLIDPQGNQFQTFEVYVAPNKGIRAEKILPNIPTKATITFKTTDPTNPIHPTIPTIKILTLKVYAKNHMDSPYSAIFENIPVVWE